MGKLGGMEREAELDISLGYTSSHSNICVWTAYCVRGKTSSNSSLHAKLNSRLFHPWDNDARLNKINKVKDPGPLLQCATWILILHGSFRKSGCPRVCQIPHGGAWRSEERRPRFLWFSLYMTRFSHDQITLQPLSDSWAKPAWAF